MRNLLSLEAARQRHVGNDPDIERYNPDLWTDEFAFLNRPGQAEIQADLFMIIAATLPLTLPGKPGCAVFSRASVVWGKYDVFDITEPEAYRRDVPQAEIHILDAGHFAMDTAGDTVADLVRGL